tara:strand:- start:39 stop:386 length:348 start_codon:yes stop_codon:yes gene_type:complete
MSNTTSGPAFWVIVGSDRVDQTSRFEVEIFRAYRARVRDPFEAGDEYHLAMDIVWRCVSPCYRIYAMAGSISSRYAVAFLCAVSLTRRAVGASAYQYGASDPEQLFVTRDQVIPV